MCGWSRHGWNGGDLLNVLEANCSSKYFLSCDTFSGVAENGNFVGHGGGVQSTDRLVLTCVMFSLSFDWLIGNWNQGGRLIVSVHPFLLKYIRLMFWHIYNGCFVVCLPILKRIGIQPEHWRMDPPTAVTSLWHGIIWLSGKLSRCKYWGPAKQMVAPLSGKICNSFAEYSCDGNNGWSVALISVAFEFCVYEAILRSSETLAIRASRVFEDGFLTTGFGKMI